MTDYTAWWCTKPDETDLTLAQIRAWAAMAVIPSHVELRAVPARDRWTGPGWAAYIVRDV